MFDWATMSSKATCGVLALMMANSAPALAVRLIESARNAARD